MKSSMSDGYGANTDVAVTQRSTFDVSERHKTTWDVSNIIPFYWKWLVPGETVRATTRFFIRFSNPLEFPLMDNAYATVHWYSVAVRNLWDNARKFFGERENPGDSIDYTFPTLDATTYNTITGTMGTLAPYLGVPQVTAITGTSVNAIPFRAYTAIYNYWYRDSSIQNSVGNGGSGLCLTDDGPDVASAVYYLRQRGKRFDYYTNVTPEPQRGDAVTIGGNIAADVGVGGVPSIWNASDSTYRDLDANAAQVDVSATTGSVGSTLYPNTTIAELRNAVAIQQFLERDNRAGQLFGDILHARYGANFQDAKYAPSYIAGGRANFNFSAIPNTAQSTGNEIGQLGSIGTGAFEGAEFTYRAQEPEILMGMIMVDADLSYYQGLRRKFRYSTRYDFLAPEFEHIGDQALLRGELYWSDTSVDNDAFGYSPRFEEWRKGVNWVSGQFSSNNVASLDTWHLAQIYATNPTLNSSYIISAPPFDRVMVSSTPDNILADIDVEIYSTLPISRRSIPGLARL